MRSWMGIVIFTAHFAPKSFTVERPDNALATSAGSLRGSADNESRSLLGFGEQLANISGQQRDHGARLLTLLKSDHCYARQAAAVANRHQEGFNMEPVCSCSSSR